jgi:riboflavin kinase/FMN adenylyltransferase
MHDGVHAGHRRILAQVNALARECGGQSIVITFDPHPRTVLQPERPFQVITTTAEKAFLLEQYGAEHLVVVPFTSEFASLSAREYVEDFIIQQFNPRYIVIGYDHHFGASREGNIAFLKQYEQKNVCEIIEIPAQEVDDMAVSSSKIRQALNQADIQTASRLQGHPYMLTGTVVEGNRIGRTIGFPTANLHIADGHKLMLPNGIYAATTIVQGILHGAMLYIGDRPTIPEAKGRVIEVNILDFSGDLYGQSLRVLVHDFIRDDRTLDSLEALQAQIEADKTVIRQRLRDSGAFPLSNMEQTQEKTAPAAAQDVAIVILNYNTRRHLSTYLPSVLEHSAGARIIVADNGSPDDSVEWLRAHHPSVQILDLRVNHGFAQGYNEALRQVQADIYVILNSDVEVTAGWMEPVLEAMRRDPSIAIAQPKILAWQDKGRFEYAGAAGGWIDFLGYPFCRGRIFSHSERDTGQYDTPQECFWAAGAAFFIHARLYHAFGGFDGDYFAHNEEIDLCWRLKRAGYSVWCIPQSVVYHLGGGTLEYESPRKVFLNFRNSLYSLLKNESAAKLCWLIPARLVLDGIAGARFAAKGQFRAIWAIVRAHFSFYSHWQLTLQKRRDAQQIIDNQRIAPNNAKGIFRGSIIWAYYVRRVKKFGGINGT